MRKRRLKWTLLLVGFMCSLLGQRTICVHAEEYEYDELNRVTKVIYEDGSYVEYTYDSNGNITNVVVEEVEKSEEDTPGGETTPSGSETPGGSEETEAGGTDKEDPDEEPGTGETEGTDTPETGEDEDTPSPDESENTNIIVRIVTAIQDFFTRLSNWFWSWF